MLTHFRDNDYFFSNLIYLIVLKGRVVTVFKNFIFHVLSLQLQSLVYF